MANLLKYFDGGLPGRQQKRKPTEEQKVSGYLEKGTVHG
jgi:hypothetical protein